MSIGGRQVSQYHSRLRHIWPGSHVPLCVHLERCGQSQSQEHNAERRGAQDQVAEPIPVDGGAMAFPSSWPVVVVGVLDYQNNNCGTSAQMGWFWRFNFLFGRAQTTNTRSRRRRIIRNTIRLVSVILRTQLGYFNLLAYTFAYDYSLYAWAFSDSDANYLLITGKGQLTATDGLNNEYRAVCKGSAIPGFLAIEIYKA